VVIAIIITIVDGIDDRALKDSAPQTAAQAAVFYACGSGAALA
jgi:hypothetical protein